MADLFWGGAIWTSIYKERRFDGETENRLGQHVVRFQKLIYGIQLRGGEDIVRWWWHWERQGRQGKAK